MDVQQVIAFGPDMTLSELIKTIFNTAVTLSAVVAAGSLIYSGFMYMAASGDTTKEEKAQKGIASAVVGLIIVVSAAVIVSFILNILDVGPLELEEVNRLTAGVEEETSTDDNEEEPTYYYDENERQVNENVEPPPGY